MGTKNFPPIMGMDNRNNDDALEIGGKQPALFVRDACNLDISNTGKISLRQGMLKQTSLSYADLWQSALHGDIFARLDSSWVLLDLANMMHTVLLADAGNGPYSHQVINNRVVMSCSEGLFFYDGQKAQRMTIDTPAAPLLRMQNEAGSMVSGNYGFAVSWMIGDMESAVSAAAFAEVQQGSIELVFPYCMDERITSVRLYMTEHSGKILRQAGEYPISQNSLTLMALPALGRAATFRHLSPMRAGRYLRLWRGRLLTAQVNILYFSEAMAFHLTDDRYSFLQFPQRITFVEPVDAGIWVGQYDHVLFLRGNAVEALEQERKSSAKPVAGSSCIIPAEMSGPELSQGGANAAVWLAENGLVMGTPSGQLVELQSSRIAGISADSATCVGFEGRITALVN
ncbi:hypothetical protein [Acinetobacter entericus]|uniref:Uncharacterized protein n=1 Tax=Acinetobacter entericus TaxID=2989714 RepID=A0ABT3NEJ5_9GAMM|nr:hypothetical protein [Acinetobacter entericus]MCW8037951.1 hypothetical protein [Acinetobacter entericus]